jgi:hypothetical protein
VTNPVSLPSRYCLLDICLPFDSLWYFLISHTIRPTDLHLSPAPHFKTFQVLLICFPKCSTCALSTFKLYASQKLLLLQALDDVVLQVFSLYREQIYKMQGIFKTHTFSRIMCVYTCYHRLQISFCHYAFAHCPYSEISHIHDASGGGLAPFFMGLYCHSSAVFF